MFTTPNCRHRRPLRADRAPHHHRHLVVCLRFGGVVHGYSAIEDHAVVGDPHTIALIATDGTIGLIRSATIRRGSDVRVRTGPDRGGTLRGPVRGRDLTSLVGAAFYQSHQLVVVYVALR